MQIGKYQILTRHSEDVIGEIHRIADGDDQAAGFIRILRSEFAQDKDLVLNFHRCAKSCCSISSPYALRATEHGQENGIHYIIYENTELKPLTDIIARDTIVSIYEATIVIERVAELLRLAHLDGITHGALTPSNIYSNVTLDEFRLANFGFESFYHSLYKKRYKKLRKELPYFPPEFYANTGLERPSDIFSLNVLYYKLLVGEVLWRKEDFYFFSKGERSLIPPSLQKLEIPDYIDNVVLKGLATKMENRYTSLSQFVADLSDVKSNLMASLTPTTALLQELESFGEPEQDLAAVDVDEEPAPEPETEDDDAEEDLLDDAEGNLVAESAEDLDEDSEDLLEPDSEDFIEGEDALDLDSLIESKLGEELDDPLPETNDLDNTESQPGVEQPDFVDEMLDELGRPPASTPPMPHTDAHGISPQHSEEHETVALQHDEIINTEGESLLDRTNDETSDLIDTDTISDLRSDDAIHQLHLVEFDGLMAVWPVDGRRVKRGNGRVRPTGQTRQPVRSTPRLVNGTATNQRLQPPFRDDEIVETETLATTRTLDVHSRYGRTPLPVLAKILLPVALVMVGLFAIDVFFDINLVNSLIRQRVANSRMNDSGEQGRTLSSSASREQGVQSQAVPPSNRSVESSGMTQSTQPQPPQSSSQGERLRPPSPSITDGRRSAPQQQRNRNPRTNTQRSGNTSPVIASSEPIAPQAERLSLQLIVHTQNEPLVSEVYVDGSRYGSTDASGYLMLEDLELNRSHLLRIQKPGFEIWSKSVYYDVGGTQSLRVQLQRSRQISSMPAETVEDTIPENIIPDDTARRQAEQPEERRDDNRNPPITERANVEGTLEIRLLNTEDLRDAYIYINGQRWDGEDDTAPAEIKLSPDNYSIEVRKDGYNSAPIAQSINLSAGETRVVEFLLTPL